MDISMTGISGYLFMYFFIINIITFVLFWIDKQRAIHGKRRISEANLLVVSFLGGTIGGLLAIQVFRHKTQKIKFRYGLPVMLLIQLGIGLYFKIIGKL